MKKLASSLLFLLAACGRGPGTQDAVFSGYVQDYANFYKQDISWLTIKTVGKVDHESTIPGATVIGLCEMPAGVITIGMNFYDNALPISRKALIWHELDHCVRGLPHNDRTSNGCPVSYMNSMLPGPSCLAKIFNAKGISYEPLNFSLWRGLVDFFSEDTLEL